MVWLLLSLCGAFLVILLLEWILMIVGDKQLHESLLVADDPNFDHATLPELKLMEKPMETYADMVERPLFIQGRRPIILEVTEETNEEEVTEIENLTLFGIYFVNDEKKALFSEKGVDKNYQKKSVGDEIAGWIIKVINVDSVILEQSGSQETVMLRKPKPKEGKMPPPQARPRHPQRPLDFPSGEPEPHPLDNPDIGMPDEL